MATNRIVTFGEIMGRIAPREHQRFQQALPGVVDLTFGGAEANVAVSLAILGREARYVTALPENPVAEACVMALRKTGVDVSYVLRFPEGRFGLYYVEPGANQRPSHVTYDRDGSTFSRAPADVWDWVRILEDATWFHFTGITPAVGRRPAEAVLDAVKAAQALGLTVSCDLNYRSKLWRWREDTEPRDLAEEIMSELLQFVDVVVANEEDAEKVLGIRPADTDVESGRLNAAAYVDVARRITARFDNIRTVAVTLRESISATHNNWGGMLYDAGKDKAWFAPTDECGAYRPYEIRDIVDRVGAGDSFAAGLIYAMTDPELSEPETALRFAVASSCLKHSLPGDFNYFTRSDVENLMRGTGSGRVRR